MYSYFKYIVFLFLLIFSGGMGSISAQSLDQLLIELEQNNPGLKAYQQDYAAAKTNIQQAKLLPSTELGFGGFPLPVQTRVGAQRLRFSVSQAMPWFGTLEKRQELAEAKAAPILSEQEMLSLHLQYLVKLSYFDFYQLEESQAILTKNIYLLESLRELSLRKVEGGKASTADVLRIDIKLRELRKQIEIFEERKQKPLAHIDQLLNREVGQDIAIQDSLSFADLDLNLLTSVSTIPQKHPSLLKLDLEQKAAQSAIALIEKEAKPSWFVGADYILVEANRPQDFIGNGRDALLLKAGLRVPLQGKIFDAKIREESYRIEALGQRKEAQQDQLLAALRQAISDYQSALLTYELYEEQEASTQAVIKLLQSNYSHDGKRFDELLSLEQDLLTYELKKLEAIVDSHISKAEIEKIMGN
ncbi:MAG: TolC family protein [Bacteroidota bacterium]